MTTANIDREQILNAVDFVKLDECVFVSGVNTYRARKHGFICGSSSVFIPYNKEIGIKITADQTEFTKIRDTYDSISNVGFKMVPDHYDFFEYNGLYCIVQERVKPLITKFRESNPSDLYYEKVTAIRNSNTIQRRLEEYRELLEYYGYTCWDDHIYNYGITYKGEMVLLDLGAIDFTRKI